MTCSKCKQRPDAMRPPIEQWGPLLWTLLHGLSIKNAETTSQNLLFLKIKWRTLLESLPGIIPCKDCKDHVILWIKTHSFMGIRTQEEFVTWIYDLHEDVNKRLGKDSFPKEMIVERYGPIDLQSTLKQFDILMQLSITAGDTSILTWGRMKTAIVSLFSYYAI